MDMTEAILSDFASIPSKDGLDHQFLVDRGWYSSTSFYGYEAFIPIIRCIK